MRTEGEARPGKQDSTGEEGWKGHRGAALRQALGGRGTGKDVGEQEEGQGGGCGLSRRAVLLHLSAQDGPYCRASSIPRRHCSWLHCLATSPSVMLLCWWNRALPGHIGLCPGCQGHIHTKLAWGRWSSSPLAHLQSMCSQNGQEC